MWHIFIVVMLGGQTWQLEWSNSYPASRIATEPLSKKYGRS